MKKTTLLIFSLFYLSTYAQTLNETAAWPDSNWTISGTFGAAGLLEDPTVAASNYSFDDDATGSGNEDSIILTSPVYPLTAAAGNGEFWITVSGDYVYRYLSNDLLIFQYWDADAAMWIDWGPAFTTVTAGAPFGGPYCATTPESYVTPNLNISGFTANQLANFQYRIFYDDDPNGADWNYGFCFLAPTLMSATPPSCIDPSGLTATPTSTTETTINWTPGNTETDWTYEYGVTGFTLGTGTTGMAMTTPTANIGGLTAGTVYDVYVQANCGGADGDSNFVGPISWTQPDFGEDCSVAIVATSETDCSMATPLSLDFTAGGVEVLPSCDGFGNVGYWVELTIPANGSININLGGTATDVGVAIFDACGGNEVFCDNNTLGATTELTGFTPSATYYFYFWQDTANGTADICFEEISCVFPSNLGVSVTSGTSADISWDENNAPPSTAWEYVVQAPGTGAPAGAGTATSSNPTSVTTGLVEGMDYEFYVRSVCGGTFSAWSGPFTWSQIVPPANNDCANAIMLTPGTVYGDNPVDTTVAGATNSGVTNACGLNGPDIWYSVVVPADGNITIETGDTSGAGMGFDSVIEAFSGTCGALTSIECDDDGAATGNYSILNLTGLTPGETIYIRVWEYNGDETEPFSISAYSATLSVEESVFESFSYYPNPVKNTLTIDTQDTIENITMYNILGQEVLRTTPNTVGSEVDMSSLETGTYFVRVSIAGASKTVRVIKQ